MSEINQKLGFDATAAIATLGRLKFALDQVNNSLGTFVKVSQALRGGTAPLQQATVAAQQLATAAASAQVALSNLGTTGANAGRQVTLSWETVGRVLQTQALVRGLSNSIAIFQDASEAAAEYQVKIAQISNIAEGEGSSIEELTESVRKLAIELGRPLPEVSGAVYEALQNDLGTAAETMEILRTSANQLARVTGGDLGQAVNALSSAIKSYNLSVEESTNLGDKFFAAIDKGRITLEELESSLGTILPLAREAGVSFDEALAAFTSITRSGTTASVAITQVRNILQKVIKPTDEAAKVLERLGFRSFPELIKQSGGLIPALRAVFTEIGGDSEQLAKVFNTIRGNLGALNLLADDSKEFAVVFDAITNSAGRAADGVAAIDGTNARKAEIAFNELNVIFAELGDTTVTVKAALASMFLFFIEDAETARLILITLGTAVATTGAFSLQAALGVATLSGSIASLKVIAVGALPALIGIASFFAVKTAIDYAQGLDKATVAVENLRRATVNLAQANSAVTADNQLKNFKKTFDANTSAAKTSLNELSTAFNKIVLASDKANESIAESAQGILSRFTTGADAILAAVDRSIADISRRIQTANDAATQTAKSLGEFNFEQSVKGLTAQEEAIKRILRAEEQLTRSRGAREKAGISIEGQELARSEQKYAEELAREALLAAEKSNNSQLEVRGVELVRKALTERFFQEKENASALEQFNQQAARDRELQLNKEKANLENLARQLFELRNRFDTQGKPLSFEEIEINKGLAAEIEAELKKGIKRFNDNQVLKDLGLDTLAAQVSKELQNGIETTNVRWNLLADQLQEALRGRQFEASVKLIEESRRPSASSAVDTATSTDTRANPAEELLRQRDALLTVVEAGVRNNSTLEQGRIFLDSFDEGLKNVLAAANNFGINPFTGLGELLGLIEPQPKLVSDLSIKILELNEAINRTDPSNFGQLFLEAKKLSEEIQGAGLTGGNQTGMNEALDQIVEKMKAIQTQRDLLSQPGTADAEAAAERIREIDAGIQALPPINLDVDTAPLDGVKDKLSQAQGNAENTATAIGAGITRAANSSDQSLTKLSLVTGSLETAADRAAKAYERMALAAARAAQAGSAAGGAAQNKYTGGKVTYRNAGGPLSRGMDSQLVSMQPGEMVVNQRQSRNFFSQLQSINAGQNPSFRNTGGSVTNNIGDINVSVKSDGGVTPKTGRDIAQSLRRELRRGTSSLG